MNAIVPVKAEPKAIRIGNARALVPGSVEEMYRFATAIVRAGMQPKSFGGGEQAASACFVAMQLGAEVGFPPMAAIQNIAVINGKPGVYGPAQMALVRASGLLEAIEEGFRGKEGQDDWTAYCTVKRVDQAPETSEFSVADAKRAGLWGKAGPWQQYPKRMLRMRARSFALRDVFPDVLLGLAYTAEELEDSIGEARQAVTDQTTEKPQGSKLEALEAQASTENASQDSEASAGSSPTPASAEAAGDVEPPGSDGAITSPAISTAEPVAEATPERSLDDWLAPIRAGLEACSTPGDVDGVEADEAAYLEEMPLPIRQAASALILRRRQDFTKRAARR